MSNRSSLLEASTDNATPLETKSQNTPQARLRTRSSLKVAGVGLVAALAALCILQLLLQPMDIPDTSSPPRSNYLGSVDAENSVGQTFVPKYDNLDRLWLVLTAEQPNDMSSVTLAIRDGGPDAPVLRTVKELVSNLPEGEAFLYSAEHPGIRDPQWYSFAFEPIADSAGRKLFLSVEGKYLPVQNRVRVAMMFYNGYPQGKAFVNGTEQNAHVVFRAESRAQVKDYLGVLGENLTANKQGILAIPATYVVLGLLYLLLLVGLFRTAWCVLRS